MNPLKNNCRITTSWDDGHPLDFRVAELLTKYKLTGTFYVPRSSQKPVMNRSQVHELSKTFEIGGHTLEHVAIDTLSDVEALVQLAGSREWLEQLTGSPCRVFCFPSGKFRRRQLPLVRQAGYKAVRTVELLSTANPQRIDGLCVIPTTIQAFPHSASAYARNAAKRFSIAHFISLPAAIQSKGWTFLAEEMLRRAMENCGIFHLWGHSWEIEEQGEWENVEAVLRTMSSFRERSKSVTNGELFGHPSQLISQEPATARAACAERPT